MTESSFEYALIISGLLNIALATVSLIACGKSHVTGWMRYGKYLLMFCMAMYIALESNTLTRGLYHQYSWVSIFWNFLDTGWMVGTIWCLSFGVSSMISAAKRLSQMAERVNRLLDIYEPK